MVEHYPEIDYVRLEHGIPRPKGKEIDNKLKVVAFLSSSAFHVYCREHEHELNPEGQFIGFAIGEGLYERIKDEMFVDIKVLTNPLDGMRYYIEFKSAFPGKAHDVKCMYFATYWLSKKGNVWGAQKLIELEKKMFKAEEKPSTIMVNQAFALINDKCKFSCEKVTYPAQIKVNGYQSAVWLKKVNANNVEKYLMCTMDAGFMMMLDADQVDEVTIIKNGFINTGHNAFVLDIVFTPINPK